MSLRGFGDFWSWDPFRDLERMRSETGAMLGAGALFDGPGDPPVSIWENDRGLVVAAELPGVEPERIDISVNGDALTLSGSRSEEKLDGGGRLLRHERSRGEFKRAFELPFPVDSDGVEARFSAGVLYVTLPKAAAYHPRKIEVRPS